MRSILPTLPPHSDVRAMRELAREILAGLLERDADELPSDVALRDLGVDSRTAVALIGALATRLALALSATLVYEHPTLDALALHLASDDEAKPPALRVERDLPVDEPIALIGIGCRFPGGANDPTAFFELLRNGVDAIAPMSDARSALIGGPLERTTRARTQGGFLEDVAGFDANFFGISPREASEIDPQQRLMLEVSWEALEDSGRAPNALAGSRTGVFVGAMWQDYAHHTAALAEDIEQHTATGLDTSVIAARVSYRLGLRGPSLTVNTACSSALVAVHLACQSLRQRESTLALAGGVNLILSHHSSVAMSRFGALAPDGRCKAFDAAADGYVRGEGAGIVVLKRLADAIADGDPIYCVIRGSAVNNDGASNGLSAPSRAAQAEVLRDAYARARVTPTRVHYVEAHGTGTRLGDPIEAEALGEVLGQGRAAAHPLRIGSVKTNLGHLEAASGIASLIKVALSMRNGFLPPSLHLRTPNPEIAFSRLGLRVQQTGGAWPSGETPLAGVSSFGFGGTNAHVVLEGVQSAQHQLLLVAADDARTLQARAARICDAAQHVEDEAALGALCHASAQSWSSGRHRKAAVAASASDLIEQLERSQTVLASDAQRRIVFAYSGVGSQWAGMGRALMASEPAFREALDRCDVEIEKLTGRSVRADLWTADPRVLARCERYQPMIFAVQVALGALWESYGVVPDEVVGHSIGEVAAAHRAGILDLADAAAVVCHTARLLGRVEGEGALVLLGASALEAQALIDALSGEYAAWAVVIAAENGARSTVVSGLREPIALLVERARARGIFATPVQTDVAYHHPMTRGVLAQLAPALATITPRQAKIAMWSTTDHAWLRGPECDAAYWQRNQGERVRFAAAIDVLGAGGAGRAGSACSVIEISPHPLLARELAEGLSQRDPSALVVPSMLREGKRSSAREDRKQPCMLAGLAALFCAGHELRFRAAGRAATGARLPARARRFMPLSASATPDEDAPPFTLPLAAHSEAALRRSAAVLADHLDRHADLPLGDLLHKVARTRTALTHRATVTATSRHGLRHGLDALGRGDHARGLVTADVDFDSARHRNGRLAFVFSGHGSQWPGMCRELLRTEPVFAAAIDACDEAFASMSADMRSSSSYTDEQHASFPPPVTSARGWLEGPDELFPKRADRVQPLLFATQVALARVWLAWGVRPDVVIGHSVGEIAAAHVAGMLDLESAARVVLERAEALAPAIGAGAMALVELALPDAEALAAEHLGRIAVAVHHSPTCCVLAGERDALREVLQQLDAREVFCRWVDVDYASHGPQMQPIAHALRARLEGVLPAYQSGSRTSTRTAARLDAALAAEPRFPMFSTTFARELQIGECDAAYWARNLAEPVLFREAVEQLVHDGVTRFVEVSPHPLLGNGILETALAASTSARANMLDNAPHAGSLKPAVFIPSLRRNTPERQTLQEALGQLFVAGHPVEWTLQHPRGDLAVALPTYPFERRRHWKSTAGELGVIGTARASASRAAPAFEDVSKTAFEDASEDTQQQAVELSARERLIVADAATRLTLLHDLVRSELAFLLRADVVSIAAHDSFQELGLDSLVGLELRSRLESRTGIALSSTSMWETPTLEGVVTQLAIRF